MRGTRGSAARSWGAWRGRARRVIGTGPTGPAGKHSEARVPRAKTRLRTASAACGWRSGRSASGRRGMATSSAASGGSRASAGLPNQASAPARTPSRLPPNGASVSQMPSTPLLPYRASSCIARAISISFEPRVRGRGSSRRAACMASVEPPDTTRPARAHCTAARASASGSTPGCSQKRRSSTATRRSVRTGATSCDPARNRQTPPAAGRNPSGFLLPVLHFGPDHSEPRQIGREKPVQYTPDPRQEDQRGDERAEALLHSIGSTVMRPAFWRANTPGRYMSATSAPGSS